MSDIIKTHDLGCGWFANVMSDDTLTVRNCDKGIRIDLPVELVQRLRAIFKADSAVQS